MTPEQWQQFKQLADRALALDTAGQRALVVEAFPEDAALQAQCHDLLTHFTLATLQMPGLVPGRSPSVREPSERAVQFAPGDMCGRFEVVRLLGTGGQARVYLARDTELSTLVALKVLSEHLLESSEARIRLRGEAQNAAKLRGHPHIATLLDLIHVEVQGRQFPVLVMEYVEGMSCAQHVAEHAVSPARALRWALQVAQALEYAHDRGVLHCDLKPHNVQVLPDDSIKVLDFGVARALYGPSTADAVAGTIPYMAPEQLSDRRFTESGDIYSLGVTLYELLTRSRPFDADTPAELVLKILGQPAPAPSSVRPGIPAELDGLVVRALAKSARHRPQSMGELRQAIAEALARVSAPRGRSAALQGILWAGCTAAFVLSFTGFVTSMSYDLALGRIGRFSEEWALMWPVWGARMLIAPLVTSVFFSLPLWVIWWATGRWRRSGSSLWWRAATWIGQLPSRQLGIAAVTAGVLGLNVFFARFSDALGALNTVVSGGTESLSWLRPGNFDEHNSYSYLAFLLCAANLSAWSWLCVRRRDLWRAPHVVLPAVGAAILCVSLGLWALPFRLLWHAELERVRLGAEICYVAAQSQEDLLLFCPTAAPPRSRVVRASDPQLARDAVVERVFTRLDASPE